MSKKSERKIFSVPVILAAVFVVGLLVVEYSKSIQTMVRGTDEPPTIDFTWTPIGRVNLKEMVGTVKLEDDHALDFSTYKVTVMELNREIGLPVEGVIGRDYEQQMSFAMFDGNLELLKRQQMTLKVEVADDAGQKTEIEQVVKLKLPEGWTEEMMGGIQLMTN
jgi:hypothetical protein